jgi:Zn ribbon nucleic-acid-binding protein
LLRLFPKGERKFQVSLCGFCAECKEQDCIAPWLKVKKGLGCSRTMASTCNPWQHMANVPFHIICVLLVFPKGERKFQVSLCGFCAECKEQDCIAPWLKEAHHDFTHELLELIPLSASLDPGKPKEDEIDLEETLSQSPSIVDGSNGKSFFWKDTLDKPRS